MRWKATLLAALMAAVALAGCTDDGGSESESDGEETETQSQTSTTTGTTTQEPEPEKRAPVTWTVDVQDNSFAPASLTIQVGDTVEWTQSGSNPHTVTADNGEFDSHPDCEGTVPLDPAGSCMGSGDTFSFTFDEVGVVPYFCKVHGDTGGSGMSGSVAVEAWYNSTPSA